MADWSGASLADQAMGSIAKKWQNVYPDVNHVAGICMNIYLQSCSKFSCLGEIEVNIPATMGHLG